MPSYTYECPKCKSTLTVKHAMSDKHVERCYGCNCDMVRLVSAVPSIWKCGGNYGRDNDKIK